MSKLSLELILSPGEENKNEGKEVEELPKQLRLFGSRLNADRKIDPEAPHEFRLPIAIEIIPLPEPEVMHDTFIEDLPANVLPFPHGLRLKDPDNPELGWVRDEPPDLIA